MKTIITLLLLTIPFFAFSQKDTTGLNLPLKDGKVVYEGIIEMPGMNKNELYNNAKLWFIDFFNSSKDVIQDDDKDLGSVVGKGIIPYSYHIKWEGTYNVFDHITVKVDCRDNKYRYIFYDQFFKSPNQESTLSFNTPEAYIDLINGKKRLGLDKAFLRLQLANSNAAVKLAIESLKLKMASKSQQF